MSSRSPPLAFKKGFLSLGYEVQRGISPYGVVLEKVSIIRQHFSIICQTLLVRRYTGLFFKNNRGTQDRVISLEVKDIFPAIHDWQSLACWRRFFERAAALQSPAKTIISNKSYVAETSNTDNPQEGILQGNNFQTVLRAKGENFFLADTFADKSARNEIRWAENWPI